MPSDDEIRRRLIRNSDGPVEAFPIRKPDEPGEFSDARRGFYHPALPRGYAKAEDDQLANAHAAVDAIRNKLRARVDQIWQSEPSLGVDLSPAQKHAWRKSEVKRVVEAELESRLKLVRPVVTAAAKELESRRGKLTSKGSVKLTGVDAERAMRIGDHFAKLDPERRILMALEAMNDPTAENRELLQALAWSHPSMELVPADTRQRIQGVLVGCSDPDEYSNLTQLDNAISATSESIDNLERWASGLAEEMG